MINNRNEKDGHERSFTKDFHTASPSQFKAGIVGFVLYISESLRQLSHFPIAGAPSPLDPGSLEPCDLNFPVFITLPGMGPLLQDQSLIQPTSVVGAMCSLPPASSLCPAQAHPSWPHSSTCLLPPKPGRKCFMMAPLPIIPA